MTSVVHDEWPSSSSTSGNGFGQGNGMNGFAQQSTNGTSGHRASGFTNYRVPSTGVDCWDVPPPTANGAPIYQPWNPYDYGDYKQEYNNGDPTGAANRQCDPWIAAMNDLDRDNLIRGKIGLVVNQRYKIVSKISFGSYGAIYVADDLTNPLLPHVAVKFETGSDNEDVHLNYEYNVYKVVQGSVGIPSVHWYGKEFDHQIMVMDLLGPTIAQTYNFCSRKFTLETVLQLSEQMLARVRHLHELGFIHRDIKPENFLMGIGYNETICHLIDFGLARRFREDDDVQHIQFRKGKNLVGTARYASLNSHNGIELSRRDDLESLGYIIIEMIIGELPWREVRSRARFRTKKQSYSRIKNIKETSDWNILCPTMGGWIRYCRELPFDATPDYGYLFAILANMRRVSVCGNGLNRVPFTGKFDWLDMRDSDPEKRYSYQCLFRWTLPKGVEPDVPATRHFGSFGFR